MFISFFGCSSFKYASIEKQNRISERAKVNFNELDVIYTDEEEDQLIKYFNQNELNRIYKEIEKVIKKIKPKIVFTSPKNDLNRDHEITFNSTLVAARSNSSKVKSVFSYELPGHVKMPFLPNHFEDVTKQFEYKIKAFKMYKSEVMKFPHPRSIKAIENLVIYRGIQSGVTKAEAFELIKNID